MTPLLRRRRGADDASHADLVEAHLEAHAGPVERSYGEIVPGDPPIDVLFAAPDAARAHRTLATRGMSARPMTAPRGREDRRFAELTLSVGPEWPVGQEAFEDEAAFWPVRLLRRLARIPHEAGGWLWLGHTASNGDPPEPWGPGTALAGAVLAPPRRAGPGFRTAAQGERRLAMLAVVPAHDDELGFALRWGGPALIALLRAHGVDELLDPVRPSVVAGSDPGDGLHGLVVSRLVPAIEPEDENLEHAQALLGDHGIGPDDAANGVVLPPGEAVALHSAPFFAELRRRLEAAPDPQGTTAALSDVREELELGTFPV